jgi:hypothetical protein
MFVQSLWGINFSAMVLAIDVALITIVLLLKKTRSDYTEKKLPHNAAQRLKFSGQQNGFCARFAVRRVPQQLWQENMTDNIIELTPFRADLTRALARRGEKLLASPDLADEVATLQPLEAYYIVREAGLGHALPILLQLSREQLETCIDLDCWQGYDFAADSLDEWLTAFALDGPETLARSFFALDYVVQLLFLAQTITVFDPDTDQVPQEDEENTRDRAMTPDGFYLLELKTELALKIHPFTVLDALYMYDATATHQLLSEVRVDLQTQIEEEALRFRNGRMEDIGFVPAEEANVLFSRPAGRQLMSRPPKPLDGTFTGVPAVYASPFIKTTLLQQALSQITDQELLSRLEQELVWAINSAIIAYGETTKNTNQITDIAGRVRDTISLGLETLLVQQEAEGLQGGAAANSAELLTVWCITDLFRHGFAATQVLKQEVRQALRDADFHAWFHLADVQQSDELDDRLERAFVAGLLGRHPLLSGFDLAKPEDVKAFASLSDIAEAQARLKLLIAKISSH